MAWKGERQRHSNARRGILSCRGRFNSEDQEFDRLSNYDNETKEYWLGKGTRFFTPIPKNGRLTIYRTTIGNEIRIGDYVSNSKEYALWHKEMHLPQTANLLSKEVGLDELSPADGPNEFWLIPKSKHI